MKVYDLSKSEFIIGFYIGINAFFDINKVEVCLK